MNIIIIGASSGIGKEASYIFAEKGHSIICSSRDKDELIRLVSDLNIRYESEAYAVALDLSDLKSTESYQDNIYDIFKTVDCVLVTAGTMLSDEMEFFDRNGALLTTSINYTGIMLLLNDLAKKMMLQKYGKIICLSSVAGERGRQSNFIYGASKAALITYLQGLRMILHKYNIQVTTVLPGYIDTPMSYGRINGKLTVSPRYAAKRIYRLLNKPHDVIYIPSIWRLIMLIINNIPEFIFKRLNF